MASGSGNLDGQLQEISDQLDLHAEAISKLVELVSNLEGVDAAALKLYPGRFKRLRGDMASLLKTDAPATDSPSPVHTEEQVGVGSTHGIDKEKPASSS